MNRIWSKMGQFCRASEVMGLRKKTYYLVSLTSITLYYILNHILLCIGKCSYHPLFKKSLFLQQIEIIRKKATIRYIADTTDCGNPTLNRYKHITTAASVTQETSQKRRQKDWKNQNIKKSSRKQSLLEMTLKPYCKNDKISRCANVERENFESTTHRQGTPYS